MVVSHLYLDDWDTLTFYFFLIEEIYVPPSGAESQKFSPPGLSPAFFCVSRDLFAFGALG